MSRAVAFSLQVYGPASRAARGVPRCRFDHLDGAIAQHRAAPARELHDPADRDIAVGGSLCLATMLIGSSPKRILPCRPPALPQQRANRM